ncbi:large conductance mechanosensitive channel protein MscL [Aliiglaciecola sp. LCG003]|uniref:large conductance mechanosensitive channel protein MscL n=1 Tax=Aliiglaciecola sp. LCG003 TaxID=3053655 RepID=UPI002572B834|nr:large conductance mechanosensitive channel protein MscL [Aliiglaciecola sp. LCG003]WJG11044.1 large conductance mechanosensitive channel protein MscL [Aliiglaciecola sp. LCG003]
MTFQELVNMLKEFKAFLIKGNMIDMAVGIIIGAAFSTVVKSLVTDVIMPPIGYIMGGVDFTDLFYNLGDVTYPSLAAAKEAGAPTINFGVFINNCITLVIVGFCVFMLVKAVQRMQKKAEEAPAKPAKPSEEVILLTEIRDALKKPVV